MNIEKYICEGLIEKTKQVKKEVIGGVSKEYVVYKIRLDLLYFNDRNDRIATSISKYLADGHTLDIKDKEQYNRIIENFIYESNIEKTKNTKNNIGLFGQQEPGVILSDGRIIDGNRRFTCLRMLNRENPLKYQWFEAIILDKNINEKDIKLLELMIQHGKEERVDYNTIDKLVGLYNDVVENEIIKAEEYSQSTRMPLAEVKKRIEEAKLMVEFLEYINAPKRFYIAKDLDLDGPLYDLVGILKNCDPERIEEIKHAVFNSIALKINSDIVRYIRSNIKPILKSEYCDQFLDEQENIAIKIQEILPDQITSHEGIQELRANIMLRDEASRCVEKFVTKVNNKQIKQLPLKQLNKAFELINDVDLDLVERLNNNTKNELLIAIDEIQDLINRVKDRCKC